MEICKQKGLNGQQGVIIPIQNVPNLYLTDEIVKAVQDGKFSVYAVSNVDEGIEILTGESSETINKHISTKVTALSENEKIKRKK